MPGEIAGEGFQLDRDLNPAELEALVTINNKEEIAAKLTTNGWTEGTAGICLLVHLKEDNSRVDRITLHLVGTMTSDWISANRLWPKMTGTAGSFKVKITFPSMSVFNFVGGLASDLLDLEDDNLLITRDNNPSSLADLRAAGGGTLCSRTVCVPTTGDWVKVCTLLVPRTAENLLSDYPAEDPNFPGIRSIDADVLFTPPNNVNWGLPWFPLIVKGHPEAALDHVSCFDLRNKLSAFLRSAAKPKSSQNMDTLATKWQAIAADKENSLLSSPPDKLWPEALDLPLMDPDRETRRESKCFF
jgi:hypothetical protein